MKLSGGAQAVVDIEKLRDYCLSAQHPEGRHKARVFLSALGMGASDAEGLRNLLLVVAADSDNVTLTGSDLYGIRYSLDFTVFWNSRESVVRSAWIVKSGEEFPRLTTCYVLKGIV